MTYDSLINQIIDKNDPAFADFPDSLNGEKYLGGDAATGWKTMSLGPAPVPAAISKLQLKYALGADWPTVKAYIDADPSLLEDWNLASEIHRESTLVNSTATALGYTSAQMDDIFRAGANITI